MTLAEVELRLAPFQAANLLNEVRVSETAAGDFRIFVTLHPHVPVTKRLMLRLEEALGQKLNRISILRTRTNVLTLRFTLKRLHEEGGADRVQEIDPASPRRPKRVPIYLRTARAFPSDSVL